METNLIYCGDNLEVLAKFPEKSVDLIYADPPFFSNKQYEIIWGNGAEQKVYEDRWKGGINVYIEWMKERLWQCYRVLKDTGSMYLHCDRRAVHRLRVALDEIFKRDILNEIIWHYGLGAQARGRHFSHKHDNILLYTKSDKYTFNTDDILDPPTEQMLSKYCHSDKRGRYMMSYGKKYYMPKGKKPDDVWDIPAIAPTSSERQGKYPTQKPEALLKKIILASSNPSDIVLDPFCGCGTTLVVAHQLGRQWIGIDVSPIACNLMKQRLGKVGATDIRIIGAPKTIDELKKLSDWEFQNWVIDRIGGVPSTKKSADMGIDGYTFMAREPVQVKQSEGVGRNIVDNFETAIRREHKTSGYIVAFSFAKGAYEEAARAKLEEKLDIKLVRVDEMDKYFKPTTLLQP
jgi:DNA modification methylase